MDISPWKIRWSMGGEDTSFPLHSYISLAVLVDCTLECHRSAHLMLEKIRHLASSIQHRQ
jgi:hypothetical protein